MHNIKSITPDEIISYCLSKPGAYLDYPFDPDTTIVKVENRIFAQIFNLKGEDKVTFNCILILFHWMVQYLRLCCWK